MSILRPFSLVLLLLTPLAACGSDSDEPPPSKTTRKSGKGGSSGQGGTAGQGGAGSSSAGTSGQGGSGAGTSGQGGSTGGQGGSPGAGQGGMATGGSSTGCGTQAAFPPASVQSVACTVEGLDAIATFPGVDRIVMTTNDALYLYADLTLARYLIAPGEACSLTLDKTFGKDGKLRGQGVFDPLTLDAAGNIYSGHGTDLLVYSPAGVLVKTCAGVAPPSAGPGVVAAPDGSKALMWTFSEGTGEPDPTGPTFTVIDVATCQTTSSFKLPGASATEEEGYLTSVQMTAEHLLIARQTAFFVVDLASNNLLATAGNAQGDSHICFLGSLASSCGQLNAIDSSPLCDRGLKRYSSTGAYLGEVSSSALGFESNASNGVSAIGFAPDGTSYLIGQLNNKLVMRRAAPF